MTEEEISKIIYHCDYCEYISACFLETDQHEKSHTCKHEDYILSLMVEEQTQIVNIIKKCSLCNVLVESLNMNSLSQNQLEHILENFNYD